MTPSSVHPVKILFVCVGNACRSQMAEAWANHFGKGRVEAYSAGTYPFGLIAEDTYTVMSEKGISLDHQCSKGLGDVPVAEMDVVVRMGTEVECPVLAGFKGRVVDWNVFDPYARGIESFRIVRDIIERQVQGLLADFIVPDASA
ncbi:MAG: arsenate reductase ArsC [Terriglobia bacterium]